MTKADTTRSTTELIGLCDELTACVYGGKDGNGHDGGGYMKRRDRIRRIVDEMIRRADADDPIALTWLEHES